MTLLEELEVGAIIRGEEIGRTGYYARRQFMKVQCPDCSRVRFTQYKAPPRLTKICRCGACNRAQSKANFKMIRYSWDYVPEGTP